MRHLVLLLAAGIALLGLTPAAAQSDAICIGDRTGDQRQELNPDRPDLLVDPDDGSDLVEVCVGSDGSLQITTAGATGLADAGVAWRHPGSAIAIGVAGPAADGADLVVLVGIAADGRVGATVATPDGREVATCDVAVDGAVVEVAAGCVHEPVGALQATLRLVADPTVDYTPIVVDRLPDGGGLAAETITPPPSRLAGADRIGTALAIAQAQFPDRAPTVYLARADDLADAVAGATLADGPILLVPRCGAVPPAVTAAIDRLDPAEVIVLGGEQAVCEATLRAVADGRPTGRLAGIDRYATAAEVAARAFPGGADEVFLARGDDLADAVAAGSLTTGPVLLVPGGCGTVPDGVHLAVRRILPSRVVALGGSAAVCDEVLQAVAQGDDADADLDVDRIAGDDRFDTAARIAARTAPGGAPTLFLARADDPADAVAGGVLTSGPTVVVPRCGAVPPATAAALDVVRPDRVVALGGPGAICDDVLVDIADLAASDR